ncbi:hypothetical protein ACOMHN_005981 [Nucella lapillus]
MVLQGTKRSLRTGNTLRNTRDRRLRKREGSVIVRHVTNAKGRQQTDDADDSYLTADGVEFSLNKKGRWNLPGVIEENIASTTAEDTTVALLRRHRVNRQNDCVSVVACGSFAGNQAPSDVAVFQRKKARRKTYCNGLNVLHNGRGKSKKETRKKKVVSTKKDLAYQKQKETLDTVPENAEVNTTPEVRYDVFYPLPATSSLRFQPKFSPSVTSHQQSADIERSLILTANVKTTKGSYQRHKHIDYDDFCEDNYYDDWINGEDDYPEDCMIYADECEDDDHEADALSDSSYLYSGVVEQALQVALVRSLTTAGRPSEKRKSKSRKQRRGRFFYSPKAENEFDSCLEDDQSETSTESDSTFSASSESSVIKLVQIPSAIVELSREAASPRRLSEQYGLRYTEAACSPRKIVVEITDRVQAALTNIAVFRDVFVPLLDLTTYLIFTYISPSDQKQEPQDSSSEKELDDNHPVCSLEQRSANVDKYDLYRAQFNMNCMAQELTFSLPEGTKFNDVEDILEQVLNLLATLTPENLVRHPLEASASTLQSRLKSDFSTLAEVNGWKASAVSLLDEQGANNLPVGFLHSPLQSRNVSDQDGHDSRSSDNVSSPQASDTSKDQTLVAKPSSEMYCHICFTELSPDAPQGPPATALIGCQHWFCDGCWQFHLAVSMRENISGSLQCPEFQCGTEVDLGTLLSLQPVPQVLVQQRRLVEVKVMRMFLCKWCPNPRCGRVVKLPTSASVVPAEPTSMSCPCGARFCFRCHGDPHWPLSCEDFREYQTLLRKRGILANTHHETGVVVRGKNCPSCHRFIEKVGGCPEMTCICSFQFWWCCRKPATEQHYCLRWMKVTDLTHTTKRVIHEKKETTVSQHQQEWLEMAVRYRSFQRPGQVKRDYGRAQQLRRNLQSLSAKGVDTGVLQAVPEKRLGAESTQSALLKCDSARRVPSQDGQSRPDSGVVVAATKKGRRRGGAVWKMDSTTMSTTVCDEHTLQIIRQTTHEMVKLKMELHSVLENTAAFLQLQQDAGRAGSATVSKVKDSVHLLQCMVTSLDVLLGAQGRRDLTRVLPGFRRLHRETKDILTTLAGLVHR